jgi:16S rRNA (guanine527-N7)-methyltransferase
MFHVKHEAWGTYGQVLGLAMTPDQVAALSTYEALLVERAVPMGMISEGDRDDLRERHVLDSLRAAPLLDRVDGDVADLGSGAGLPGIPLAVIHPDVGFALVDRRQRRAAFLELVVDTLSLANVEVLAEPIEQVARSFAVCLARALADPLRAWRLADPLLSPAGKLLYWAGRSFDATVVRPAGVHLSTEEGPGLADAGPIVIMTRQ